MRKIRYCWIVNAFLTMVSFAVYADSAIGTELPAFVRVDEAELPSEKDPLTLKLRVAPKDSLRLTGYVAAPDMTNYSGRVSVVFVKFYDWDGNEVQTDQLIYSKAFKSAYFHVKAGPKPCRFTKKLSVPSNAVSAEVKVSRFYYKKKIVLHNFRCESSRADVGVPTMRIVSVYFLLFVSAVFIVYFAVSKFGKCQPWVLLASSVVFYSFFIKFAFLFLAASATSIWLAGLLIGRLTGGRSKKWAVFCAISFNIALLVVSKYLVAMVDGFCELYGCIAPEFSIVLPLGISFYTLQAVSYCVDVYRGTLPPERNFFKLFLYLIFFPTIMQGPISRYGQIGCQLWSPHSYSWERMQSGLELALWGFFKKMVIADRAAMLADTVFAPGSTVSGIPAVLGVVCYSIQIYADFSGCVDICRGICEVMGIDLIDNFKHPYFATSIKDFWRRWHISLSTWLRDYVYIPLGGNRHGTFRKYLNVLIVFGVSGIWHGVGINFFIWGLLHGLYQLFDGLTVKMRTKLCALCGMDEGVFSFRFGQRIWTFVLVSFAWIFFRAPTLSDAWSVVKRLFEFNPWTLTDGSYLKHGLDAKDFDVLVVSLVALLVVSILQEKGSVRMMLKRQVLWFRWLIYLLAVFGTLIFGVYGPGYNASQFIYMGF